MTPSDDSYDAATSGSAEPTARGDRTQRRADVLAAAAAELEQRGWDDFSIRAVANRVGVSAGAVYQWFAGKGEIWAHIQQARFIADAERVEAWERMEPLETVGRIIDVIASNHADIGRHRFGFVAGLHGEVPDYAIELAEAHRTLADAIKTRVDEINNEPPDQPARLSWLWAVGKGVGDHMVDSRYETGGVGREEFLEMTNRSVLAGLCVPIAPET